MSKLPLGGGSGLGGSEKNRGTVIESIFLSRVEGSMSRVEGTMSRVIFFSIFFYRENVLLFN